MEQKIVKIPSELLESIKRDGAPAEMSNVRLYGNRQIFKTMLEKGYTSFSMGKGPWIGEMRIVGIAVFYGNEDKIATYQTMKGYDLDGISTRRGTREQEFAPKEFEAFVKKYRLEISPDKLDLKELVDVWIK